MKLELLLQNLSVIEIIGHQDQDISLLTFDSRTVVDNALYVAIKGEVADGHSYIDAAILKGAIAIVCETLPISFVENVTYILVKDASKSLGCLASNFYDNPSKKLKLVGVTGTNGKTSVTTLLFDIFKNLGYPSALIPPLSIVLQTKLSQVHTQLQMLLG